MYEIECLTTNEVEPLVNGEECSPFFGECYPIGEGCCGPDCNPNYWHFDDWLMEFYVLIWDTVFLKMKATLLPFGSMWPFVINYWEKGRVRYVLCIKWTCIFS